MHESIAYLPASDLRELYAAKSLSPVEVTRAILDRIEQLNPVLNAFTVATPELALKQAAAAERAYASGQAPPLAGIPTSIKDLTPTRGIRTARGSLIDPDWVPEEDAPIVERLYDAGVVMLGKTNTPELGWKGDSGNRVFGPSFNPWHPEKTPGGSSGGAAAAVAAGLGPLAQGSDGAGSIRIPAAFCGIFGIKPSFGLVPQYPPSAVGDLSHLGPLTRTVRDAAMMLNAMAGADARDRLSWSSGVDYTRDLDAGVRGLRIAWSPSLGYARVASDVLENAERAAMTFRELGCEVELVDPDLSDPTNILDVIWSSSLAGYFAGRIDEVRHLLDPGLLEVVERAASLSAVDLAQALQQRNAYFTGMRRFMERFDLLLTPTLPVTAFTAGLHEPDGWQRATISPLDWTPYTFPFNLTGQPAATVPCGFDRNGLPVGLQIVGRWRDDSTVLRAAAAFESLMPWTDVRPPLSSPGDVVS